jgi:hypothetical protein
MATATDVNALPMLDLSLRDAPREPTKALNETFSDEEHDEESPVVRYEVKINHAERAASTRAQASFLRIRRALRRKVRARVAFGNKAVNQNLQLSEKPDNYDGDDLMNGTNPAPKFPIIDATVPANAIESIDFPKALAQANVRIREVTVRAFEARKHIQSIINSLDPSKHPAEYERQVGALAALPCATKMLKAAPGMPAAIKRAAQARGVAFEYGIAKTYKTRKATPAENPSGDPSRTEVVQLNPHSNPEIANSYVAVYISPRIDNEYTTTEFKSWEPLFQALHQTLTKMLPIGKYQDNIQGLVDHTIKIGKQFLRWKNNHKDREFRYAMPYSKGAADAFGSTRKTFKHMATGGADWKLVPGRNRVAKGDGVSVEGYDNASQEYTYYAHIAFHTKGNVWPFLKVNADVWAVCRELRVDQLPPACRPLFVQLKSMKLTEVCKRINGNRNGIYVSLGKFCVARYQEKMNADYVTLKFNPEFLEVPHIIASINAGGEIQYNVSQLFSIIVLTGMRYFRLIAKNIIERKERRARALSAKKGVAGFVTLTLETVQMAAYAIKNYSDYLTEREQSDDTRIIRENRKMLQQDGGDLSAEERAQLQAEFDGAKARRDAEDTKFRESNAYKEFKGYVGYYKRRMDFYDQFAGIIAHEYNEPPVGSVFTGRGPLKNTAGLFDAVGRLKLTVSEQWNRIFTVWARSATGRLNYTRFRDEFGNDASMGKLPVGDQTHVFPALDQFETPTMANFFGQASGTWVSDALCDWSKTYVQKPTSLDVKVFEEDTEKPTHKIGQQKWAVWAALNILRAVDDDAQLEIAHQIGKRFYTGYDDGTVPDTQRAPFVRSMALEEFFGLMEDRFQQAVKLVAYTKKGATNPTESLTLTEPDMCNMRISPIKKAYQAYGPGFVLHLYGGDKQLDWKMKSLNAIRKAPVNKAAKAGPSKLEKQKYPGTNRSVTNNTPAYGALNALKDTVEFLYDQALDVCEGKGTGQIETHTQPTIKGAGEVDGTEFRAVEVDPMETDGAAPGPSTAASDGDEDDGEDDDDEDEAEADVEGTREAPPAMNENDDLVGNGKLVINGFAEADELMKEGGYETINDAFTRSNLVDLIEQADVALDDPELQYNNPDDVLDGVHETYEHAMQYEFVNQE